MSKPVRVPEYVAIQVQREADGERRSFANMVEVLLLAALEGRGSADGARRDSVTASTLAHETKPVRSSSAAPSELAATVPGVTIVRPHMKKHRPAVECPERVVAGECPLCGTVVT